MVQADDAWDFEWDYTMGSLEDYDWTKEVSSNCAVTLTETSLRFTAAKTSGNYARCVLPTKYSKAVMEVDFLSSQSGNGINFYWIFALSTPEDVGIAVRCQFSSTRNGIYLNDASTVDEMTKFSGFDKNTRYTIRLVLDGNHCEVYRDGVLLTDSASVNAQYGTMNRIQYTAAGSGTYYGYLYSVKMKFGRT